MAQKLKKFDEEQPLEGYLINLIEPFKDDFIIHGAVLIRDGHFIEPDGSVNRFNDCREKLLGWVYTFEPRPLPPEKEPEQNLALTSHQRFDTRALTENVWAVTVI